MGMKTCNDSPYPTRVEKRGDDYVVICSATVFVPEFEDISDVEDAVEREAVRAAHRASADLLRQGLLVA